MDRGSFPRSQSFPFFISVFSIVVGRGSAAELPPPDHWGVVYRNTIVRRVRDPREGPRRIVVKMRVFGTGMDIPNVRIKTNVCMDVSPVAML